MNEDVPINLGHWIQIIIKIPEISSTDHSHSQTTDKRILSWKTIFALFRVRGWDVSGVGQI